MSPTTDGERLAVLEALMTRLDTTVKEGMAAVTAEVASTRAMFVSRGEWVQRNAHVDDALRTLRAEVASRRVSWPVIATAVVAVVSLALAVLDRIT